MHTKTVAPVAVSLGILLGIGTRLADDQENALTWLGSLAAPWVFTAFAIGAMSRTWQRAVLLATGSLVLGVGTYYLWMRVFEGGVNLSYFVSTTAFWLIVAPIAGVIFGISGWTWWRKRLAGFARTFAVALPGGMVAGESGFMALTSAALTSGEITLLSLWITIGLMMPVVLLGGLRQRLAGFALTLCFLAIGIATIPVARWIVSGFQSGAVHY